MRPARINDAAALGVFFLQSWKESGPAALGFTGATDAAIKELASEGFLTRRLSNPSIRIVVAEGEGRILGFASVRKTVDREGELSGIVVLESETGKGLGTRLIQKAFQAAVKLGVRRLSVKTEVLNERALRFYETNGFTRVAKTTQKFGSTKVPLQVLERKF